MRLLCDFESASNIAFDTSGEKALPGDKVMAVFSKFWGLWKKPKFRHFRKKWWSFAFFKSIPNIFIRSKLHLCPTDPQTLKSHKPNENHETFVKSEISNLKKLSKPYANHETFVRCGVQKNGAEGAGPPAGQPEATRKLGWFFSDSPRLPPEPISQPLYFSLLAVVYLIPERRL